MDAVAKLKVLFEADSSALDKALGDVGDKAEKSTGMLGKLGGAVGGVTSALGKIGLAGMGISMITDAVGSAAGAIGGLIGSAEALGDAQARVNLVFGEKNMIADWAVEMANGLGMTQTAYINQVGALGQLTTSLGVNKDAAAEMSATFVELAPKLAAYAGVEKEVADDALEKALMGKTKGLAALGIAITDADKAQAALSIGIRGEAKDWTEAQIAQINYAAVMEKTGAAQEAWADNATDVEVSMARISASVEDAKATLGEKLLPLIAPLAQAFAERLPGALETAIGMLDRVKLAIDPLIAVAAALAGAFQNVGSNANFGGMLDGTPFEMFSGVLKDVEGVLSTLGEAYRDFMAGFESSDASGILGQIADGFRAIGGDDVTGPLDAIAGYWDAIQEELASIDWAGLLGIAIQFIKDTWSTVELLWPSIETLVMWVGDKLKTAMEELWPEIKKVIDWMVENKSIVIAVGGVIMTLVGGPITALIGILAALGVAWRENWGGIQEKTKAFVDWFNAEVVPTFKVVMADISKVVQEKLAAIEAWWTENGDTVIATVQWIVSYVSELFSGFFTIVSGIVQAGLALLRGDWEGFGEGLGKVVAGIVNTVATVFRGTYDAVKRVLTWVWEKIKSLFSDEGEKAAGSVNDGIIEGIKSGAGKVYQALKDLASGMIKGFMDNLGISSPSKVFAELGEWITAGLASGIAEHSGEAKVIESMLKIVKAIADMASALPDAINKLVNLAIPDDATIDKMAGQFMKMLDIVERFVKLLSPHAVMLGVGPGGFVPEGVKRFVAAFGLDINALITQSDANNVGKLMETVQKTIGAWGAIAEALGKIADVKIPAQQAFDQVVAQVYAFIEIAKALASKWTPALIGLQDMADGIKAATDILMTGAALDLSKATKVAQGQIDIARANLELIGKNVYEMMMGERGFLARAGDDKARAAWIDALKDYADTVSAAVSILKAGDVGNLADIAKVTQGQINIARANLDIIAIAVWDMMMGEKGWMKVAPNAEGRQAWIDALKDYADTLGAAVDIFRAGVDASGKLETLTLITAGALDIIKQNLIDIASTVAGLSKWSFGFVDKFGEWAGNVKTAVDIFKAGADASKQLSDIAPVMQNHLGIVKQNVIDIASTISSLAKWSFAWPEKFAEWAGNLKTALDIFKAGADASKTLADIATPTHDQMETVKFNLIAIGRAMLALTKWKPVWPAAFSEWAAGLKTALDIFKAGADASKTLAGVTDFTFDQMHIVKFNLVAIGRAMLEVANWKPVWPKDFDVWAKGVSTAVSLFASVAKSLSDIGTASIPDVSGKLGPMKDALLAMLRMIGEIAQEVGLEEAKARAELAEALGRASGAMGDFSGGIQGLLELAQSKLFGSDVGNPARGPLSFAQRTRGRRADFFATQIADTVKRAVQAVQDALAGVTLTVDDAKVEALSKLGAAFGAIADGLTKLAESKLPDARKLAEIVAALTSAQTGLGGVGMAGAGAGAGGGAGGGAMTLNLSNPVLNFPPITASVTVTSTPTIMIGHQTVETLATIIERRIAERFVIGSGGGGSPITVGGPGQGKGRGTDANRRSWG